MPKTTSTPAFPEGSTVRHRATGRTYTVAHLPSVGDYTWIYLSEPREGSSLVGIANRDLEPVEGPISDPTPSAARVSNAAIPAGFTLTSDDGEFLDAKGPTYSESDCIIDSVWSSDKGHQFFLERRTDEPFTLDELTRLADLLKIIQLRHTSSADLEAEARRRGLGGAL